MNTDKIKIVLGVIIFVLIYLLIGETIVWLYFIPIDTGFTLDSFMSSIPIAIIWPATLPSLFFK